MWLHVPEKPYETKTKDEVTEMSLFTGYSGFGLTARLAFRRVRTVCYVEREAHQAATLVARMEDEALDHAPVWDYIETFRGRQFRGSVDILTASMPCQPYSLAGKQLGIRDPRWLWRPVRRVINQVRPRAIFMENVCQFRRVLHIIIPQLEQLGYTVEKPIIVSAADVGSSHLRKRIWILAHSNSNPIRLEPWWRGRADGEVAAELGQLREDVGYAGGERVCEPDEEARTVARQEAAWEEEPRRDLGGAGDAVGDAAWERRREAWALQRLRPADGFAGAGATLGDPDGVDWWTGTPMAAHLKPRGRSRSANAGADVGDADVARLSEREGERGGVHAQREAAERAGAPVGYTYSGGQSLLEERDCQQEDWFEVRTLWSDAVRSSVPLFPPGREDAARGDWSEALWFDGGLSPALPKSEIRGVVDGTSGYVDQLRSNGNGLVPLAGAYALCTLAIAAGLAE